MWRRIGFRFVLVYIVLFLLSRALVNVLGLETRYGIAPGGKVVLRAIDAFWIAVVSWFGRHALHLAKLRGSGGDLQFGYVEVLCFLAISAVVALVWGSLDRNPTRNATLRQWLRVVVRYALAFEMLIYGMDKVVPYAQFSEPPIERLVMPLGSLSRYAVFWSSMGTSPIYAAFAGATEVMAGLLLLLRPSALAGPLLAAAALANVIALNMGFDIPVKIFSIHLLLLAIFLLAPDAARLVNVLLLDRPGPPHAAPPKTGARWRPVRLSLKAAVIVYIVGTSLQMCLGIQSMRLVRSPLYGIYDVVEFTQNGALRPPLTTDAMRWRRVIFDGDKAIAIQRMDDSMQQLLADYDAAKGSLTIKDRAGKTAAGVLGCTRTGPDHLLLQGAFQNQPVIVKLERFDDSKLTLSKSHFHWMVGTN